jgi:hypothetical protein
MRLYSVASLKDFLDFSLERNYPMTGHDATFEDVVSHKEIINARFLLERCSNIEEGGGNQDNQRSNNQGRGIMS